MTNILHRKYRKELPQSRTCSQFEVGDTVDVAHPHRRRRKRAHPDLRRHRHHEKGPGHQRNLHRSPTGEQRRRRTHFPDQQPIHQQGDRSSRSGETRRAKLFYLRDRIGKATRLAEVRKVKKEEAPKEASRAEKGELVGAS